MTEGAGRTGAGFALLTLLTLGLSLGACAPGRAHPEPRRVPARPRATTSTSSTTVPPTTPPAVAAPTGPAPTVPPTTRAPAAALTTAEPPASSTPPSSAPAAVPAGLARAVVDLSEQHVYLYRPDGSLAARAPVSTGSGGRTPTGEFRVQGHTRVGTSGSDANVHMDYASWFDANIGFHGIPWVGDRSRRLWTPLGVQPVSHGCVRMADDVAAWVYAELPVGAPVTVQG